MSPMWILQWWSLGGGSSVKIFLKTTIHTTLSHFGYFLSKANSRRGGGYQGGDLALPPKWLLLVGEFWFPTQLPYNVHHVGGDLLRLPFNGEKAPASRPSQPLGVQIPPLFPCRASSSSSLQESWTTPLFLSPSKPCKPWLRYVEERGLPQDKFGERWWEIWAPEVLLNCCLNRCNNLVWQPNHKNLLNNAARLYSRLD